MSTEMLDRFTKKAPFAVMTRMLAQGFIGSYLNQIFDENRQAQYDYIATFEAVAVTVADVALNFSDNFNQAYKEHKEELGVTRQSFFAKTRGVEPAVSEAIVRHSANQAIQMQEALGFTRWELLEGYNVFAIDGNVPEKSDKRLGVLRESKGAPMPGKMVARFDLQRQLFDHVYVLLNGHDQESACCDRIVDDLKPKDVIIADRHYCIVKFMEKIAAAFGFFVLRHHGRLKGVLLENSRQIGRVSTGMASEQEMKLSARKDSLTVRRISVELDTPTRDGDKVIHILTNLPSDIEATEVAELYRHRWEEETAFHVLQMTLTCEHSGIGHPQAAAFLFCTAVLAYNLRQTIFAALFATHDEDDVIETSHFHISKNISDKTEGMLIAITEEEWQVMIPPTTSELASVLKKIASQIDLEEYRKARRGPKTKKPYRSRNVASAHVSTAKLLGLV